MIRWFCGLLKEKPCSCIELLSQPKDPEKGEPGNVTSSGVFSGSLPKITLDPPPNLSTKPEDKVAFAFAYVCPDKHVNAELEKAGPEDLKKIAPCQTCGKTAKLATIKKISEARWQQNRVSGTERSLGIQQKDEPWRWSHFYPGSIYSVLEYRWTRREFVQFLDRPRKKK